MTVIGDMVDEALATIQLRLRAEWEAQVATSEAVLDAIKRVAVMLSEDLSIVQIAPRHSGGGGFITWELLDFDGEPLEVIGSEELDALVGILVPEVLSHCPHRVCVAKQTGPTQGLLNIRVRNCPARG